ncbi:MAG: head GIN domain-containing protein [Acidobacteriota bacterium]
MNTSFLKSVLPFFAAVIFAAGCSDSVSNPDTSIHGSGRVITESRTLEACEGVTINSIGEVYLTQAETQSIRIEADDNIMNHVVSERQNGILVVGLKDGSYSNTTVRIYVSLKDIKFLSIEGAGNIETVAPIAFPSLSCIINGAGNITLRGQGDDISCILNGAGEFKAKLFTARNFSVILNGAGTCTATVSEKLDAIVNGVGTVVYYGNPPIVKTAFGGVGRIVRGS